MAARGHPDTICLGLEKLQYLYMDRLKPTLYIYYLTTSPRFSSLLRTLSASSVTHSSTHWAQGGGGEEINESLYVQRLFRCRRISLSVFAKTNSWSEIGVTFLCCCVSFHIFKWVWGNPEAFLVYTCVSRRLQAHCDITLTKTAKNLSAALNQIFCRSQCANFSVAVFGADICIWSFVDFCKYLLLMWRFLFFKYQLKCFLFVVIFIYYKINKPDDLKWNPILWYESINKQGVLTNLDEITEFIPASQSDGSIFCCSGRLERGSVVVMTTDFFFPYCPALVPVFCCPL